MRPPRPTRVLLVALLLCLTACAPTRVVPASLEGRIDGSLTFDQLKRSPGDYVGRVVVLGGEVLSARRLADATRLEVLQLPLGDEHEPRTDRLSSEGRFLAFREEFLDPATLPAGTRVTIVGEVTGSRTLPLDETQYTYPTVQIEHLTVWPEADEYPPRYPPSYYSYWGPPWPYWAPYRPFWPYWW